MSATDRGAYAARQAELLDALLRGDGYPEGFVAVHADAAGRALRRKRGGAVRHAWPALAVTLGAGFDERFDAFARTHAAPAAGGPLADGMAFARWLRRDAWRDSVRVELLFARALLGRGVVAGATRLHDPARLLVVARVPGLGVRYVSLRLGARR